jgi:hypothetical protein
VEAIRAMGSKSKETDNDTKYSFGVLLDGHDGSSSILYYSGEL